MGTEKRDNIKKERDVDSQTRLWNVTVQETSSVSPSEAGITVTLVQAESTRGWQPEADPTEQDSQGPVLLVGASSVRHEKSLRRLTVLPVGGANPLPCQRSRWPMMTVALMPDELFVSLELTGNSLGTPEWKVQCGGNLHRSDAGRPGRDPHTWAPSPANPRPSSAEPGRPKRVAPRCGGLQSQNLLASPQAGPHRVSDLSQFSYFYVTCTIIVKNRFQLLRPLRASTVLGPQHRVSAL